MTLEDRVEALESTLGTLLTNLLEPALVGPYLIFGDGAIGHLNNTGIQFRTTGRSAPDVETALWFTDRPGPDQPPYPRAWVGGYGNGTDPSPFNRYAATQMVSALSEESYAGMGTMAGEGDAFATANIEAAYTSGPTTWSAALRLLATIGGASVRVEGAPFVLPDADGDFANLAARDGSLQYDSTAHKGRIVVNGTAQNIATEAYADAAVSTHEAASDPHTGYVREADANWVDLTDGGATTLHSHAAGGGVASDTIFDAKGDLAVGTGADAAARLGVGSNGQVLTADSSQATGLKWAAAGGGMKKVQGSGYQPLPAGPGAGVTVTKSASADTYGAYAELRSASGNALYIWGVVVEDWSTTANNYAQVSIATGAAGSETEIAAVKMSSPNTAPTGTYSVFFPAPIAVAANTRIAARWANSVAAAHTCLVSLIVCNQADLVDL